MRYLFLLLLIFSPFSYSQSVGNCDGRHYLINGEKTFSECVSSVKSLAESLNGTFERVSNTGGNVYYISYQVNRDNRQATWTSSGSPCPDGQSVNFDTGNCEAPPPDPEEPDPNPCEAFAGDTFDVWWQIDSHGNGGSSWCGSKSCVGTRDSSTDFCTETDCISTFTYTSQQCTYNPDSSDNWNPNTGPDTNPDPTDPTNPDPTDPTNPTPDPDGGGGDSSGGSGGGDTGGTTDPDPTPDPDGGGSGGDGSGGGGDSSANAGTCEAFTCNGEAVLCELLKLQHEQACAVLSFKETTDSIDAFIGEGKADKLYEGQVLDFANPDQRYMNAINLPGSCPAPVTVTVLDTSVSFSYDPLCDVATMLRPLIIAFGWFAALLIVGRGISAA